MSERGPEGQHGSTIHVEVRPDESRYTVQVRPDDLDGGYIAECPELPGVMSQGETAVEAEANCREAITEVLAMTVGRQVAAGFIAAIRARRARVEAR